MKKVKMDNGYNIYKLANGVRVSVLRCTSYMFSNDNNEDIFVHGFEHGAHLITDKGLIYGNTTLQELYNKVK